MRIAFVHWAYSPVIGGVESHLAVLGRGFAARGHTVSLLTGWVAGEPDRVVMDGMDIRRTPLMSLDRIRDEGEPEPEHLREEFGRFLDETRADIVHAHNLHYFSPNHMTSLVEASHARGLPVVLTAHNVWDDDLWRTMTKESRRWDGVIAVSHYIARELVASGFPSSRIRVVHHGLDLDEFQPRGEEGRREVLARYPELAGRRIVFHPARSSVVKGSLLAVQAFRAVHEAVPEAALVLAGTGTVVDWTAAQNRELAMIEAEVERLGLQDHVFFRSFSRREMADFFQIAEVAIYPSQNEEPFGLAVLEAMATACPVVVTRSGGMPEFVSDGETGFIIERGDGAALAERVERLLREPTLRQGLGERARRYVLERHGLEKMLQETEAAYEEALQGSRVVA